MKNEQPVPVAPVPTPAARAAAARPPTGWVRPPGAWRRVQTLPEALLCRLGAVCLAVLQRRCRRIADALEREHPGPHLPGTLGAEVTELAARLRAWPAEPEGRPA